MTFTDTLIRAREKLVNCLIGVDLSFVLNPMIPESRLFSNSNDLGEEIKKAMNAFKSIAMDAEGYNVNYKELATRPEYGNFCDLVSQLHHLDLNLISTTQRRTAFWINLYNAQVIDAVIQFGVERSVTEKHLGVLSFFQRAAYAIGGQRFSLTDIEHGILRSNRGFPYFPGQHFDSADPRIGSVIPGIDPRIHFALNCASQSCPPIGVYAPKRIDDQLDLAARSFIHHDLQVNEEKNTISLSSIFRWYQVDFGGRSGILEFLLQYLPDDQRKGWILQNRDSARLVFKPYDWGLNQV